MFDSSWLWVIFTVIAAAAQTVRNATQRELTAKLGTVGATHVRFLFGFPFAFVFLAAVMIALGQEPPRPPLVFWPWVVVGALAQVAATALMLAAMNDRDALLTTFERHYAVIAQSAKESHYYCFILLFAMVGRPDLMLRAQPVRTSPPRSTPTGVPAIGRSRPLPPQGAPAPAPAMHKGRAQQRAGSACRP